MQQKITLITGPMKASKSQLIALFFVPEYSVVIKPYVDDDSSFTRSGLQVPHTKIIEDDLEHIVRIGETRPIIFFDEFHFFEENTLKQALDHLSRTAEKIFLVGLEKDIVGIEWSIVKMIKGEYDPHIVRLTAQCEHYGCELPATENLFVGDPDKIDEDKGKFKVYCKIHHPRYLAQVLQDKVGGLMTGKSGRR